MTKKKLLLNENATRRFMKLASIDPAFVSNFLNEAEEEEVTNPRLEQLKDVLRNYDFYKNIGVAEDKASELTDDMVKETDKFVYLQFPGELDSDHLKKHFDKSNSVSTWSITPDGVSDLILRMLEKEPTKSGTDRQGLKHKWLNMDVGRNIGHDSLVKVDKDNGMKIEDDLERFGMIDRADASKGEITWKNIADVIKGNKAKKIEPIELVKADGKPYTKNDFETRTSDGKRTPGFIKQEIGVVSGNKKDNPTELFNLVTAEIGKYNEKPVLALVTVFPGHSPVDKEGNDVMNKKDYKDHGYAFLKSP